MIVNIDETRAIWFGIEISEEDSIPYNDAVYLLMESQGYTKKMIEEQFSKSYGPLTATIGDWKKPPNTSEKFIDSSFSYISEFSVETKFKRKEASIINASDTHEHSAKDLADFLFMIYATK